MSLPHIVNVYGLMLAPNVCNQELREVMRFSDFSVAHVITHAGDSSQLHEHHIMKEMYYIASGSGVLTVGEQAFSVDSGAYVSIPPNTPHRLHNSANKDIEYLVLATPPFQTKDVDVILDTGEERIPQPFKPKWRAFEALDGATVYEVDSAEERRAQGFGVAIGFLPPLRAATSYYDPSLVSLMVNKYGGSGGTGCVASAVWSCVTANAAAVAKGRYITALAV